MSDVLKSWTQRIREEEDEQKFDELRDYLDENSRQYGKSSVGLFCIRLAHQKLEELKSTEKDIQEAMESGQD